MVSGMGGAGRYVAMGSSFAAGPGLKPRAKGAPLLSGRSQRNYAHLVATRLGLQLRDQTYSGATIAEIAGRADVPRHPDQADAADEDTRLVTVTGGGNDVGYLPVITTASMPSWLPVRSRRATVPAFTAPGAADRAFERLKADLEALCTTIRSRSGALLVLTDYLTVIPADPAAGTAPLPPATADWGRRTTARLTATISEVAAAQDCVFVPLGQASRDHHAWSADPWIRGFHLGLRGGAPYHPTITGMAAAADLVTASILRHAPHLTP
jgi:GDSL-like Lipase/Acylhydrolase family